MLSEARRGVMYSNVSINRCHNCFLGAPTRLRHVLPSPTCPAVLPFAVLSQLACNMSGNVWECHFPTCLLNGQVVCIRLIVLRNSRPDKLFSMPNRRTSVPCCFALQSPRFPHRAPYHLEDLFGARVLGSRRR